MNEQEREQLEERLESIKAKYHNILWELAKAGWQLVAAWACDQKEIDCDWVQVDEILAEWREELESS